MRKHLVYPALIIATLALHYGLFALLPGLWALVPVVVSFAMMGVIIVLEKVIPFHADWNRNPGDFKADLIWTLVVLPIVANVLEWTLTGVRKGFGIHLWPDSWPWSAQLIFAILAAEFGVYWIHRLAHEVPFLWRFHAVHHGSLRVYWANSGRFHIVDALIEFTVYFIPIYLLGAPKDIAALFITLNAVTGILEHANIDYETVWLSRIFNTAELHRAHHSGDMKLANNNYGKITSIWDSVFGTYVKPARGQEDFNVGLSAGEPVVPNDFEGQLRYPFDRGMRNLDNKDACNAKSNVG